jgi:hypothetical protein
MTNRPLRVFGALFGATVLSMGGAAQAAPADPSPVGGEFAHAHHIHTGNGGCVDIDSVFFEPDVTGLHRAANNNFELDLGMLWHGTCAGETVPGGPPLPPFVPHH